MLWLPDHVAFGFSYFSMGLSFKNRHISRKVQQVVKFIKAEDSDCFETGVIERSKASCSKDWDCLI